MFNKNENNADMENSTQLTTDDLIFSIGDKETVILAKNKQINNLKSQLKIISNRLSQSAENEDTKKELTSSNEKIENLEEQLSSLEEQNKKLKHTNKEFKDLKNDNERLYRLLKEKEKKINDLLDE